MAFPELKKKKKKQRGKKKGRLQADIAGIHWVQQVNQNEKW